MSFDSCVVLKESNYSASGAQQPFAELNSRSLSGVEANKPASTPLSLR